MRSLALANQKGGVGKTTTAVHLAHGLALSGRRVALFDLDPQGNATVALQGMRPDNPVGRSVEGLHPVAEGLWVLPSPGAEAVVGRQAVVDLARLQRAAEQLEQAEFDWLLVDCPPRMDEWGWAGLQLCNEVLIPVQAEFFAMHGLSQMLETLEQARAEFPGKAEMMGVVATIVDMREAICVEVVQDLHDTLAEQVFRTTVLRDPQLVEAASHGRTLFSYNPTAKGALCYGELVREVLDGRSQVG